MKPRECKMEKLVGSLGVALFALASAPALAQNGPDWEVVYRAGTDSAMRYLNVHMGTLRVTLLLQECGYPDLARRTGEGLPNSVEWFLSGADAKTIPASQREAAAQITRGYLLGYEAGVRTEFRRRPDEVRAQDCATAVSATNSR